MGNSYGDIMKVETTGASQKTAQQDKLGYSGVRASHTMAQNDADRMKMYSAKISNVGKKNRIDRALIAAIISRESRAGKELNKGFGLMQIDRNRKPRGTWESEDHLDQGTKILVECIEDVSKRFPGWNKKQQLKGGIAAYDAGVTSVVKTNDKDQVDDYTTNGDYSSDVVARAQWYKENVFKS